ncbi:MAG: HAD family phosphatase [Rhabdochlamydiaceae bacterium]|jgi:FMN phosphatase YigB (HAD superfamily)
MKRTIFFDLGNVLVFFDHQKMYAQVATYCDLDLNLVETEMQRHGNLYERGDVDSKGVYEEFCRLSQKKLHFDTLMAAMGDIFKPNDPVIAIALELKKNGHRLFLLSNTCDAHFVFASSQFPFLKYFDGYVLSYEVGALKPEKKIYEKALEIAGCEKKDCFYTDDILDYIETARSIGIDAEQYKTPHDLTHHLNARKLLHS